MPSNLPSFKDFLRKDKKVFNTHKAFLTDIKTHSSKRLKQLDDTVHEIHYDVFEKVDCLTCANCCKTTSPVFKDIDIDRISKKMQVKPSDFIEKYLKLDAAKDYVLKQSPCTFLMEDNACSIYDIRPRACREYPHTDRKNIAGILTLTAQNTLVCPAVFEIVEQLKKAYK